MAVNFLSIPPKKGSEVDLIKPIERYIKANYDDSIASSSRKGLTRLQSLRNQILTKLNDRHESTIKCINEYVDILSSLESRIPISNVEVAIRFKWYDAFASQSAFSRVSMSGFSAGFERCCMMFNLASIYSQIGADENLNSDEGLKNSTKAFQHAAGLLQYIKAKFPAYHGQTPTFDMYSETLNAFTSIMLAQAQEIVYKKAEKDEMKSAVIAKIAAQASVLYSDALKTISMSSLKSYIPKEWANNISFKAGLMEVMAEYHKSIAAPAEHKYGEQLARLNKASALLKGFSSRTGRDQVKALHDLIKAAYVSAKKDNDLIYHDSVPDFKSLPPIELALLAKKVEVSLPLSEQPPKNAFSNLIPIAVHSALNLSEGVRQSLISVEINRLREATEMCNSTMTALNLPAAIRGSDDEEIPVSLLEKASKARVAGGLEMLNTMVASLKDGCTRNRELLQNTLSIIDEEEKSDDDLRSKYGDKWSRQPSSKLNTSWRLEIANHKNLLEQAQKTDQALTARFLENEALFKQLCMPENELKDTLRSLESESSSPTASSSSRDRRKLREHCSTVEIIKKNRQDLQQQLQSFKLPNALRERFLQLYSEGKDLNVMSTANEFINGEMSTVRECVRESLESQEALLKEIQTRYQSVFGTRKATVTLSSKLSLAGETFENLKSDFQQGIKFYAELTAILLKFQNKVTDFEFARKTEKKELMKDITSELSAASTGGSDQLPVRPLPTYQPDAAQNGSIQQPLSPMCWPGFVMPPTDAPTNGQLPPMPMYGIYGGYQMPMMFAQSSDTHQAPKN